MSRFAQRLFRRSICWLMLLGGLYCVGRALWNLSQTAIFAHEAILLQGTVADVRQNHFQSQIEPLAHGNLSWAGDVSYQPIVTFVMPGGIRIPAHSMPDLDNADYRIGQSVEVITMPHDPNQAHIHKWKFLWGGDCILLGAGALLGLIGRLSLRRRPAKRQAPAHTAKAKAAMPPPPQEQPRHNQPAPQPSPAPAKDSTPAPAVSPAQGPAPEAAAETKKRRAPRKKKSAAPAAGGETTEPKPKRRKKAESAASASPAKPSRSRKPRQKKGPTPD